MRMRTRPIVSQLAGKQIRVNGRCCTNFANNDYLGLHKHPKILESLTQAAQKYGLGSGASALICGYTDAHFRVEEAFANWLGVDKTLLFNTGYCANVGVISALCNRHSTVLSDKLCHASLLDGILLSRTKHRRYRHNDLAHLEDMARSSAVDLIITESVFSMEGTIAPIAELARLAQTYQAGLLIDDAHGIGMQGENGAGICAHPGMDQAPFLVRVLPLGKAFHAIGAIVAADATTLDAILQFSRTYTYTTAIPPAICAAIHTTLEVVQTEGWRREQLMKNIQFFQHHAQDMGLALMHTNLTPIQPILVPDHTQLLSLQKFLLESGFYVPAIRPPTVPKGTSRLRMSLSSAHTSKDIQQLLDAICVGLRKC